jgi:outer membrane protein assembly factor BamB
MNFRVAQRALIAAAALAGLLVLAGCASTGPKPVPLGPAPHLMKTSQLWSAQVASSNSSDLMMHVTGDTVAVVSRGGVIRTLDANTGKELWRVPLKNKVTAGVGFDGQVAAVVNEVNQVVAVENGKQIWTYQLPALTITPPLVAGGRVFVLSADRSIRAFDEQNGALIWHVDNFNSALILDAPLLLTSYDNTLVVGIGGSVNGYDPMTGTDLWSIAISSDKSGNDVERMADILAGGSQYGAQLCVRAYQSNIACVDMAHQTLDWTKVSSGITGLSGSSSTIFGSDSDGRIVAFNRSTGQRLWTNNELRFRDLTAPVVQDDRVLVGDETGTVYFLSTSDGKQLLRVSTDGSPIVEGPVVDGNRIFVITKKGNLFGFKSN